MGYEFKIETYDSSRTALTEFLRKRHDFLQEEAGVLEFGTSSGQPYCTVAEEERHVCVCLHALTVEANAMLGLVIRRLLSMNDHVVVSEL